MSTSKKFSELPAASSVGNGDLFAIAHEDALAETGYVSQKLTAAQAGQKVNGDTEYPTSLPSFPANGQNPFAALEKLNADIDSLYPVNTASGSIANFTTSLAKPLTALSSTIVAQQAGTGTPSPSNPRSISGVSSVGLVHTGKNLLAKPFIFNDNDNLDSLSECFFIKKGSYIASFGTITNADNWRFIIRLKDASGNNLNTSDYITFNTGFQWSTTRKAWINSANTTSYNCIFTLNQDCYIRILFGVGNTSSSSVASNAQLEQGSTATAYEAYNAETKTIALGQTVYGGVIDAKSGKATITHGKSVFDGSDENWSLASDGTVNRRFVLYGIPALKNGSTAIANYLVYATETSHDWGTFTLGKSEQYGYYIVLHDKSSNFASTDALKAYLAEHNLELVYELATPVEITGLTPANFTSIIGEQNIFSDSGDISVSFKQGIQEYIDAKIAETQALIL